MGASAGENAMFLKILAAFGIAFYLLLIGCLVASKMAKRKVSNPQYWSWLWRMERMEREEADDTFTADVPPGGP